ncbi:molybdopterin-dependent oxidoreductase FAD-binding subunit [Edwardsiella piscicida]|uniref:molybdopterin-dependent oxidoreductase FAD-binding subunit n=1 Tax=Edwardsiella piscicida TaxID=1263550 RepID=UPI0002C10658|nr:molybdopterin-dependent oxidoreductase FAD-binding subunit [Edwardsiella piscicida]AGH75139.1 oxidoreductase [Edwardsiella piscicida C07-087]AOP44344.1 molybdopterin-dependent oxidoreductase FAD-binding subunit [Edwardsiella piscicida]EKS7767941.1 molybdopterin-dependent oxidoreductase FAD-binding subunit [Edwardsiella piscicida]EKS7768457.1 molybdopterin-dependent oxidoreductase FAD-binding subunit [Edwardsiella piscicida]EKS7781368.1 molybdopterin-dependent oxidoreductase FAD-binding subu
MIEQFFRPDSVEQALELKRRFQDQAVYFAGGSKLNATPTRTEKTVAISLKGLGLDRVTWHDGALHLGALTTLQQLRDTARLPQALQDALGFVYSRHLRNQSTLGGELAARQAESVLAPVLLALDARLQSADGAVIALEEYLAAPDDRLLTAVIIDDPLRCCATRKVSRSAAGWSVVTAAVAFPSDGGRRIALDGVASRPQRLRDVEGLALEGEPLAQAVSAAIAPSADLGGSEAYKRYIAGVVVAELLADCQQMREEAK